MSKCPGKRLFCHTKIISLNSSVKILQRLKEVWVYTMSAMFKIPNSLPTWACSDCSPCSTPQKLLKLVSDILLAADGTKVTMLGLLDLSAAFDTVDHTILLDRLRISFGLDNSSSVTELKPSVQSGKIKNGPGDIWCSTGQCTRSTAILVVHWHYDYSSLHSTKWYSERNFPWLFQKKPTLNKFFLMCFRKSRWTNRQVPQFQMATHCQPLGPATAKALISQSVLRARHNFIPM